MTREDEHEDEQARKGQGVQRSDARAGGCDRSAQIVEPMSENAMLGELPGNEVLPRARAVNGVDLPPPDTKRWVVRRKAVVVAAVRTGAITLEEACRRYGLSIEEFHAWQRAIETHGTPGLRVTRLQVYRDISRMRPAKPRP